MRKILLSAVAVAAIAAAAPASAQSGIVGDLLGGLLGGGRNSGIERIDDQIRIAHERGELSPAEARRLEADYFDLRQLEQRYRQNGLSREERFDLQRRTENLERRLETARFDRDDRFNDRFDDRYDRDDRSFGRNGCPPGLAKKNPECLPPGQAKKQGRFYDDRDRDFSPRYRDRQRDGDRYIYRQDNNGRLLQIDRRTGRVVRVIARR